MKLKIAKLQGEVVYSDGAEGGAVEPRSPPSAATTAELKHRIQTRPLLPWRPNANKREDPTDPSPREVYLSWDDYFMSLAFLSAMRSKDPNKQVGAVITGQDRVILGIGYNGFPRGCSDELLPWAKKSNDGSSLGTKYPYVCHAEMNAIMNKNSASLRGASIYVTMFPCNNCAKLLIQAGIREVVFFQDKRKGNDIATSMPGPGPSKISTVGASRPDPAYTASQRLLAQAGVKLRQTSKRPIWI